MAADAASEKDQMGSSAMTADPSAVLDRRDQQDHHHHQQQPEPLDTRTIEAYEALDKWKECIDRPEAPSRMVYTHNRSRAAGTGFPTRLTTGSHLGLTPHETAALFGWTTGDYRFINPIARGAHTVDFDEYPFLPQDTTKVTCRLQQEDVVPYIQVLQSALSKLPALSSQQRLWRGHRRTVDPATVGSMLTLQGFASVTRDREQALEFATKANEGRSKKRTLIGIVEHASGKCVSKLSARPSEREVVFPPDIQFEVVAPPTDTADDDRGTVQRAAEQMQQSVEGAEIDLVYVREISMQAGRQDSNSCSTKPTESVLSTVSP